MESICSESHAKVSVGSDRCGRPGKYLLHVAGKILHTQLSAAKQHELKTAYPVRQHGARMLRMVG